MDPEGVILRRKRPGTKRWDPCLCVWKKSTAEIHCFVHRPKKKKGQKQLKELPVTEEEWKAMPDVVLEVLNIDANSRVHYGGSGLDITVHATEVVYWTFRAEDEASAKALVRSFNNRLRAVARGDRKIRFSKESMMSSERSAVSFMSNSRRSFTLSGAKLDNNFSSMSKSMSRDIFLNSARSRVGSSLRKSNKKQRRTKSTPGLAQVRRGKSMKEVRTKINFLVPFQSDQNKGLEADEDRKELDVIVNDAARVRKVISQPEYMQPTRSIMKMPSRKAIPIVLTNSLKEPYEYQTHKSEETRRLLLKTLNRDGALTQYFLKEFDETARNLMLRKMYRVKIQRGKEIVALGQPWDQYFIVEKGLVRIYGAPETGNEMQKQFIRKNNLGALKKEAGPGKSFGATCLMHAQLSEISARAETNGVIWGMRRNVFHKICIENQGRQQQLKLSFIDAVIDEIVPIGGSLHHDSEGLVNAMEITYLSPGQTYCEKPGEREVFFCCEGRLEVIVDGDAARVITSLLPSSIFGLGATGEAEDEDEPFLVEATQKSTIISIKVSQLEERLGIHGNIPPTREKDGKFHVSVRHTNDSSDYNLSAERFAKLSRGATKNARQCGIHASKFEAKLAAEASLNSLGGRFAEMSAEKLSSTDKLKRVYLHDDLEHTQYAPMITDMDFNTFRFWQILGKGTFGEVLLTTYIYGDVTEMYALKIVKDAGFTKDKKKRRLGIREKLVMNELTCGGACDFLVKFYQSYIDNHSIFLVTEYCSGGDLENRMLEQPSWSLTESDIQFYVSCVVLGLEAMHNRHIIHRDLKPNNIFIGEDGYAKIGDFGVAKKTRRTYSLCGTREYMAPEILSLHPHTRTVDLWALGVTAFDLALGFTPFEAKKKGKESGVLRKEIAKKILSFEDGQLTQELVKSYIPLHKHDEAENPPVPSETFLSFVGDLLRVKPYDRLGSGPQGYTKLKKHHFFAGFNWELLKKKKMKTPWVPPEQNVVTTPLDLKGKIHPVPEHVAQECPEIDNILTYEEVY